VTKILAYAAQASHELVPPDAMEPVIQAIANNFVTERCSGEVMTVGLNAMRVICARCPLAMSSTLLQDLVQYRTYKDKSVMMAARALMQLFRALNPTLLARKDRGKAAAEDADYVAAEYGQQRVVDHVPGAEVVAATDTAGGDGDGDGDDGWEVASDSDDDSDGEWVAVSHSEGEGEEEEEGEADEGEAGAGAGAAERAKAVSMTRLLTPADFAAIKKARVQEALEPGARRKRKAAGNEAGAGAGDGTALGSKDAAVSVDDIERLHKKLKMDREARIAALQANKGEKDKWLSKKQMRKEAREIGTTNTDKKKTKKCVTSPLRGGARLPCLACID
jgi:protein SDA1